MSNKPYLNVKNFLNTELFWKRIATFFRPE